MTLFEFIAKHPAWSLHIRRDDELRRVHTTARGPGSVPGAVATVDHTTMDRTVVVERKADPAGAYHRLTEEALTALHDKITKYEANR